MIGIEQVVDGHRGVPVGDDLAATHLQIRDRGGAGPVAAEGESLRVVLQVDAGA